MNKILSLTVFVLLATFGLQAQTLEDLKTKRAELKAEQAAAQAKVDAFAKELTTLGSEIDILSGWQTGLSGIVGLNFGSSNNWASNANPNSSFSNLNVGVNAFANNVKEKSFWRNTVAANIGWQGLDNNTDDDEEGTGFLDNRNTDVLIASSLYGYRLTDDIAISALADLNTSVFNFLSPGSVDIGVGATWTPHQIPNLVVVVHPLTYHFAFSAIDGVNSQSALGAKVKATYSHEFPGGIVWSSNLGTFLPYKNSKTAIPDGGVDANGMATFREAGLFEYTWINSIAIADLFKGIGVGITYGLRGAKFEFPDTQSYSAIGLTYGF